MKCANCAMWQYSRGLNDYGLSRSDSFTMTPKGSNIPAQGNALGGVGVWNPALKGRDIKARGSPSRSQVCSKLLARKSGGTDNERYAGIDAFDVTPFQGWIPESGAGEIAETVGV